jgi:hypothetical protein
MEAAMAQNKLKPIPKFHDEAEERAFWESHDSANYMDFSKARRVRFPNLKLSEEKRGNE